MKHAKAYRLAFYWYFAFLVMMAIGIGGAMYAGIRSRDNMQISLLERTQSIAELIDADDVAQLDGSEDDLGTPLYEKLKQDLVNVRSANHDIRFIYILALNKSDEVFFHVDSEDSDSEDYSPPGQLYPEDVGETKEVYQTKSSMLLPITSDRWGTWLSAYSPIKDSKGSVVAVLGLDVPAQSYYVEIATNALIPLLLTAIIIGAMFWVKRRAEYQQRYLADKAFFLSFASHEIRSPLTSIAWALAPLANKKSPDHTTLVKISDSMKHILGTIDDVLSLQATEGVKDKKLKKEPVHVNELIDTLIASLQLFSEEHKTIITNETSDHDKHLVVNVDTLLFKRVVSNFLVNAVKYSPPNTTVDIRVIRQQKTWMVSIHNEGNGLSKEDQAKIMQGFYRTKEAEAGGQKGTGLGVMLSRDIIARHNGKLELESTPHKGVTFKIILPL